MAKKKKEEVEADQNEYLVSIAINHVSDEQLVARYPNLAAMLLPRFDGTTLKRQEGKLSVFKKRGYWVAQIEMPTEKASGELQLATLVDLLDQLEDGYKHDRFVWDQNFKKRRIDLRKLADLVK